MGGLVFTQRGGSNSARVRIQPINGQIGTSHPLFLGQTPDNDHHLQDIDRARRPTPQLIQVCLRHVLLVWYVSLPSLTRITRAACLSPRSSKTTGQTAGNSSPHLFVAKFILRRGS